ncbi:hypothetical protein MCEMIE22_01037 [Mycobacteriaceae bacterium]
MRRVIGPILTTGVSLVTAGVVVANPIVAPRADVAIPAVQLSAGNTETIGMLDQAFLDAIAPGPAGSSNPFSVLKDLISGLAADATSLGKDVIVDAFVAGVAAVSPPELTAASSPYVPFAATPVPDFSAITDPRDFSALVPSMADVAAAAADSSEFVANDVAPVVREFVASLAADVEFVSTGLIEAAFAVGALVAHEPILIARTLTALVSGDLEGALANAVTAVVAPLGPPAMVYNTLQTVVLKYLSPAPRNLAAPASAPEPGARPAPLPTAPGPGESGPGESGPGESGPGQSGPPESGPSEAGPGVADASSRTARDNRRHRNPVPDSTPAGIDAIRPDSSLAGAARKAAGAVRDAISAVAEQAAGPTSGSASESAVTDPPVADGAAEQAAPAVSDAPAKPAGRAQAARQRG